MKIFAGILFLIMMFIMPLSHAAEDTSAGGDASAEQSTGASGSGEAEEEEEEEPDCE